MRVIAVRAGRGNVSSSTVHNIFGSARVPRWEFLEHVLLALGGAGVRDEFLALWRAAENASEAISGHLADGSSTQGWRPPRATSRAPQASGPGGVRDWNDPVQRPPMRIWSNEIPSRNRYFTGREAELELMRTHLDDPAGSHVQVIVGLGGVGKTEFATEYVLPEYRHLRDHLVDPR